MNYEPTIQAVREMAIDYASYSKELFQLCDEIREAKNVEPAEKAITLAFNLDMAPLLKIRRAITKAKGETK